MAGINEMLANVLNGSDIVTLFIIHAVISVVFFLVDMTRRSKLRALVDTAVVFFIPVFGLVIMVLYNVVAFLFGLYEGDEPEKLEYGTAFFLGHRLDDDIVPLNDVYLVPDIERKRRFFTEAIKGALVENHQILNMAMHDADREVAYYAVSLITSRVENLESQIFVAEQKLLNKGDLTPNDVAEYAKVLKDYLNQREFIDYVTWHEKQRMYIDVLRRLHKYFPDNIKYYADDIDERLRARDYDGAKEVYAVLADKFPGSETASMELLKIAVEGHDRSRLDDALKGLDALRAGGHELSDEANDAYQYWARNDNYHKSNDDDKNKEAGVA